MGAGAVVAVNTGNRFARGNSRVCEGDCNVAADVLCDGGSCIYTVRVAAYRNFVAAVSTRDVDIDITSNACG